MKKNYKKYWEWFWKDLEFIVGTEEYEDKVKFNLSNKFIIFVIKMNLINSKILYRCFGII